MTRPTHSIGIHVFTSTPEEWDYIHDMFQRLMRELSPDYPAVHLSSYLVDEEDGVEEGGEYFDQFTMVKVVNVLQDALEAAKDDNVEGHELAVRLAEALENEGVLFRERRGPVAPE